MKKLLAPLSVVTVSLALVITGACSSSTSDAGGDAGSSGSSGFGTESGASGSTGESGTSGSSGAGDGAAGDSAVAGETPCDPAKTDCKAGEVCTDIGRSAPVCRAGCKNDAECTGTPKSGCVILTPGTPATGACIPTCKAFGTDCAAGFTCSRVPEQTGVSQTSPLTYCKKTGATALGGGCVNDPASCGANADCIYFPEPPQNESVNDSKCHTLCDPTHPCGTAKGDCFTKTGDTFGFCNGG
jgi:collagen type VII alpha